MFTYDTNKALEILKSKIRIKREKLFNKFTTITVDKIRISEI